MKQIIQSYRNGKISLDEVPAPGCKAGGLLVRTAASLISPGTEGWMIAMGRKSLLGKARARPDLVRQVPQLVSSETSSHRCKNTSVDSSPALHRTSPAPS